MINLTNLLPEIWNWDNSRKKNGTNDEANGLINKYQMMTLKKKINF
jgi:hypothetical protein